MSLFTRDKPLRDKSLGDKALGDESLLYPLLIFLLIFGLYALSAPRTVVLEDDGLFIMAAYFNGLAHPPGYPVYTLLGHLITYLPIGSIAYRVHLLSALFGALGCVALWSVLRRLKLDQFYAVLGSLALGLSGVYWSQAIIAEAYSLNVWLFLLLFILALRYAAEPTGRIIAAMGLLYGLSLSNHWPLLLLSTPMLLAVLWPRRLALFRQGLFAVPGVLLGLLPYLWLFIRSQMGPEISFYGPLDSWSEFWFFVSREGYSNADHSPSAGWWDKWQYMGFVLRESIQQVGLLGLLFCVWGFIRQWSVWPRTLCVGLLLGYLFNTLVLIGLLGFDYELLHRNIFRVYPLIAYSVLMIWLALGLQSAVAIVSHYARPYVGRRVLAWGLGLVAIGTTGILNAKVNYRADDTWARDYARTILETLPQDAVLFVNGDVNIYPLGYFNKVEDLRPDITLYSHKGLYFPNRLFSPMKDSHAQREKAIKAFVEREKRPIYYTDGLPGEYRIENHGLYKRIIKDQRHDRIDLNTLVLNYLKQILDSPEPHDRWEKMHYWVLMTDYCGIALDLKYHSNEPVAAGIEAWVDALCNNYLGYLLQIESLLSQADPAIEKIEGLAKKAEGKENQIVRKWEKAKLNQLRGEMYLHAGDKDKALDRFHQSIADWRHPDNASFARLRDIKEQAIDDDG